MCDKLLQLWKLEEYPGGSDLEIVKYNAEKKIRELICDEARSWLKDPVNSLCKDLEDEFLRELRILKQECDDIDMLIEGRMLDAACLVHYKPREREVLFSREEKIILGVTAILWVPLVVIGTLFALPVAIGVGVAQGMKDGKKLKQYYENKLSYLHKWMEQILQSLTGENVERLVKACYLEDFTDRVELICRKNIPKLIKADEMLINNIANDMRCSSEILMKYQPLQYRAKVVYGSLLLFGLQLFPQSEILEHLGESRSKIGEGTFADVFVVDVSNYENITKAAVKVFRKMFTKAHVLSQMAEIDCLR